MTEQSGTIEIVPIGVIHSCYGEKFGIPRQPGLVDKARQTIEIKEPFARGELFKGLERFSHIWVQFVFHAALEDGWKATVRPPRLGGRHRIGVFATRSPHRPNHIGLSAVRLLAVHHLSTGVVLEVGGGDFLDQTPVIDIKPYIPYCDCLQEADRGYAPDPPAGMEVRFSEEAEEFCRAYARESGRDLSGLIEQVLSQDPRPASQRSRDKEFGMRLWDVNIRWVVLEQTAEVRRCDRLNSQELSSP